MTTAGQRAPADARAVASIAPGKRAVTEGWG